MTKDQLGKPEVVWLQDLAQIYNPRPISIQVSIFLYVHVSLAAEGQEVAKILRSLKVS